VGLSEDRFLVGVMGIVLNERDQLMLFRHSYRPFAPWGLPSGFLQDGETFAESIRREIREETGLEVEVDHVLLVEPGSRPRRVDVWLKCRALPGTARPSAEVEEVALFDLDALPPLIKSQEEFLSRHLAALAQASITPMSRGSAERRICRTESDVRDEFSTAEATHRI